MNTFLSKLFGVRVVREGTFRELERNADKVVALKAMNANLSDKLDHLIKTKRDSFEGTIDVFMGDPSPLDKQARRAYVAQVAAVHKDIMEPKLRSMISATLRLLEQSSNDREYDITLKGVVYALREMIHWGNMMVNEQLSYQAEESNYQS